MHIIISRTDSIGDVVLTLPVAGILKEKYPDARISFLGRNYTQPVIRLSKYVDNFLNWDEIEHLASSERNTYLRKLKADWIIHVFPDKKLCRDVKKAGIKNRVGTSHRTFHWTTCNKLVSFTRKGSDLHEAQLNCKLLSPFGIDVPELSEIKNYYGFRQPLEPDKIMHLLDSKRKNIVLHPKSKGSAREWGLDNFDQLIQLLPIEQYKIFISGTTEEGKLMSDFLKKNREKITDLTGKFSLDELIAFLAKTDAIIAASTGPLHIAAALGTLAIGIYPPIRPMHPGRWAPIGNNTEVFVKAIDDCNDCRKNMDCHCIREITATRVAERIKQLLPG